LGVIGRLRRVLFGGLLGRVARLRRIVLRRVVLWGGVVGVRLVWLGCARSRLLARGL
jgi:hypothetical protein